MWQKVGRETGQRDLLTSYWADIECRYWIHRHVQTHHLVFHTKPHLEHKSIHLVHCVGGERERAINIIDPRGGPYNDLSVQLPLSRLIAFRSPCRITIHPPVNLLLGPYPPNFHNHTSSKSLLLTPPAPLRHSHPLVSVFPSMWNRMTFPSASWPTAVLADTTSTKRRNDPADHKKGRRIEMWHYVEQL